MGDPKRFDKFSDIIIGEFNPSANIADVAGGKGYLRLSLAEKGYKNVETFDKRTYHIRQGKQRFQYFDYKSAPNNYDGIVGMHPDEGTDHIILYCGKHRVKGIICPCCIKPSAVAYWNDYNYHEWKRHLEKLADDNGLVYNWKTIGISGRNDILIINPKQNMNNEQIQMYNKIIAGDNQTLKYACSVAITVLLLQQITLWTYLMNWDKVYLIYSIMFLDMTIV